MTRHKAYTVADLKALSPEERATLYENARKRRAEGGQAIMDMIDSSGLSLSAGGMRTSDPVYVRMQELIWSAEGRSLALAATANGFPALAGVERLIVDDLGDRYHPHDLGTASAGSIVGELMRHLGYAKDREAKMPDGSVAKTAMLWKLRDT